MALIVKQPQPAGSNRKQPDQVTVIDHQFCVPYEVDLTCIRSKPRVTDRSYEITDVDGTLIFKMLVKNMSFRHKRTLLGADGNPIVTISQKALSLHKIHYIYRGGSTDKCDLLFIVRENPSSTKTIMILDVFLGSVINDKSVPDFRVRGSLSQPSMIYAGTSSTILAQTHKEEEFQSLFSGKDKFITTVCSNIDYAFAVILFLILAELNRLAELGIRGEYIANGIIGVAGAAWERTVASHGFRAKGGARPGRGSSAEAVGRLGREVTDRGWGRKGESDTIGAERKKGEGRG
ncbi:hypothetical protein ACFE04_003566 [Oxalis oulophora]